ncbi:hypothetical protein [Vibrio sp. 10N.261.55.A7]|uniref:hypothetical protein n=1 Tax=Vibrio sp. 10N.261.55.A7 TaxID=1880851 RepID=UPI000C85C181|nr:hypothetical protein [Vibrio sp. 10N.261.55.A7]PMJ89831.1 hypothetical protein BCU12_01245 [Vibrio sp. 10N.261.55.A7]
MERKLGLVVLIPFCIATIGCQATSGGYEGTYTPEVWSKAKEGDLPNLSSEEFNEQRDTFVGLLSQFKQNGLALFDTSSFTKCSLTAEQANNITSFNQSDNSDFVTSNIVISSDTKTCLSLQNDLRSNVSFHFTAVTAFHDGSMTTHQEGYSTISDDTKKHFIVLNSKVADPTIAGTNIKSLTYHKSDSEVIFTQFDDSPVFNTIESYTTPSNERVSGSYEGKLLDNISIAIKPNDQFTHYVYSESFGPYPMTLCMKDRASVDLSHCLEAKFSNEATKIVEMLKNKPTSVKISDAVFIRSTKTQQSNSSNESSSNFWAVALGAAAVAYGVDQGLTADSAGSLGSGVYDLIAEGDATQLNNATKSLKVQSYQSSNVTADMEMKNLSSDKKLTTPSLSQTSSIAASQSKDYANETYIAKYKTIIREFDKANIDSSMYKLLLEDELKKPKSPNPSAVNIKSNLINSLNYCQKSLEDDPQLISQCHNTNMLYFQYLESIGTEKESVAWGNHQKAYNVTVKFYEATR